MQITNVNYKIPNIFSAHTSSTHPSENTQAMLQTPPADAQSFQPLQLLTRVAGRKIARFWRSIGINNTTAKLIRDYLEIFKIDFEFRTQSLEQMANRFKEPANKRIAKLCFSRISMLCSSRHGTSDHPALAEPTEVQRLTAAYLVVYQTQRVFQSIGDNERILIATAEQFLLQFHSIIERIHRARIPTFAVVDVLDTVSFLGTMASYLTKFKAWQEPDRAMLVARIRTALLQLYSANARVSGNSPGIRTEIVVQITRLRKKYEEIMGAAHLASFDEANNLGALVMPELGASDTQLPMSNPETGLRVSVEKLKISHEILIDPNFTITETNCGFINMEHFREARQLRQEFWDNMRSQLAAGDYTNAIRVVTSLRDNLNSAACTEAEFTRIRRDMPVDSFAQRCALNQVPWEETMELFVNIAGITRDVLSPERQDHFDAGWARSTERLHEAAEGGRVEVMVETLLFFSEISFYIGLDSANKR